LLSSSRVEKGELLSTTLKRMNRIEPAEHSKGHNQHVWIVGEPTDVPCSQVAARENDDLVGRIESNDARLLGSDGFYTVASAQPVDLATAKR
jgi:hypothetical protein